jgi:hypothetical protein
MTKQLSDALTRQIAMNDGRVRLQVIVFSASKPP